MQKMFSVLLTLIMLFVGYIALPAKAMADETARAMLANAIEAYTAANDFSQDNSLAYSPLIGELWEERDESVKVFRRADGAQEAVMYSDPVHFLRDETWEAIDNTLELVTLEDGTQVYRNKANDFIVSFSPYFNADNLITVESKGHILSWRFTEEVPFVLEEFVNVEETQIEETEPEEAEQEEEQPVEESEETELVEEPAEEQDDQEAISDESETMEDQEELTAEETETSIEETEPEEAEQEEEQPVEESEETELAEEPAEEQDDQEAISDEPETMEDQEELTAEETETSIEEAEPEEPEQEEERPVEESEEEEPEETEGEPVYETLKITDAEAEIAEREHKEPETDRERDMLLRYPEELTSELTYKDPETGLNVHYVLSGKRLSEQIVLDSAPETAIAYTALLSTNGLTAEEKDGRTMLVDEHGEAVFEITAPLMYDANGEASTEIEIRLVETEDGYAYTLIPDEEWLTDESRAYPVVIDPDIQGSFATNVVDTYAAFISPDTNYSGSDRLSVSLYDCSLIQINSFASLKSGDIILNATMHLTRLYGNNNYNNIVVTGHRITSNWDVSTATYNNLPAYESEASTFAITARTDCVSDFDVTSLVKAWYEGTFANKGILLKANGNALFRSTEALSQQPSFSIVYRNATGLESNWTYYSQSAGRAGTGSVNLASGNLTWTLSDGGIKNGVLPISLSHVYNVNDIGSDLGYGRGWRLNYAQTLKRCTIENGNETTLYYEYTDGDGTRHYYKYQDGEYVNELDQYSKLSFSDGGTKATITDKGDNKLVFQVFTSGSGSTLQKNGRLTEIEDANGNKTLITYKNPSGWSLRISKITEQLSGQAAGQELVLHYDDSSNLLDFITVPNGLNVTFGYSVNNDLSSATYTDGQTVTFNYSEHRLAKATNIDGYNIRYVYNTRNGVRKATEYAGNTRGKGLLFGYGRNIAVVTELNINDQTTDRSITYMTDSYGQPVSVTDAEGHALFAAYNKAEQTVTQLSAVSKLQNTTVNLLGNHGFERSPWDIAPWTRSNTQKITLTDMEKRNGYFSAKFASDTSELTLSQTVSVTAGETYTLSAYFKGSGSGQVKAVTGSSTYTGELVTFTADEWTRTAVTFTAAANSVTVFLAVPANSNVVYADSVQLEQAPTPNRYNLLENTDFANGVTGYSESNFSVNGVTSVSHSNRPDMLDNHAYRLTGDMNEASVSQSFLVNGHAGDTYSFGGWMKSTCPPESEQLMGRLNESGNWVGGYIPVGIKALRVEFLGYIGSTQQEFFLSDTTLKFSADTSEWQYACGVAVAESDYSMVRLSFVTKLCIGETWVDGLQLYREEFSQAYSYDSEGNLTGYTTLIGQQNSFDYDEHNNVTSSTDPRGNTTTYEYDTKHNVTSVTSPLGVKTKYTVNAKGQVWRTRVGTDTAYIETFAEHSNAAAQLTKAIDSRGKETTYAYNSGTRLNTQITDPKGNTATYNYGNAAAMHRLASLTSTGLGTVAYGYDDYGKLTTITRGTTEYKLTYDDWSRPVSTKVGTTALSTNTYDSDFRLSTVTYANGFSARYVYDDLDRVRGIYQTENNTESFVYSFIYNGEGDLYELRNYRTHRASFFEYDHAGRCMASKERAFTVTNGRITYGTNLSSYGYQYDECNNLTKLTCSVAGSIWNTVYTYDNDNRPKTTTLNSGKVITNTLDAIGRLSKRTIGLSTPYETRFEYHLNGSNRTTLLHKYYNGSDDPFVYNYDDNGNIISITQGSTSITYEYDAANRLTRENNQVTNQTVTYEYDTWGNILNKKIYAYTTATSPGTPTSTITYTYGNNAWKDQLTSYNGQTITYDNMGNPTSYRGYTFGWRGKQLVNASDGTRTITFEYNEDGLRQKKTVNGLDTNYYYNGSVLIGMQRGTSKFLFSYDASGNVVSVKYNGTEYYYLRNAQGDIVKLIDASGVSVVEYTYDTWGKAVTTTGTLAGTLGLFQPFRYRGYVYDYETGFYYLQSRYYDPTTGRFISADVLLSTGQGVLGHNCYAYCLGNPVGMRDNNGNDAVILVDDEGVGHIGALVQDKNGNWWHFYWGAEKKKHPLVAFLLPVKAKTYCTGYTGTIELSEINNSSNYSGESYEGKYTDLYYIAGDFSESFELMKNPTSSTYHLLENNCVQVTLGYLSKSKTTYRTALSAASKNTIPIIAFQDAKDKCEDWKEFISNY
jgi:RHS repeat-associated protein